MENARWATQVHGGISITWEHDAHLYMRRATALLSYLAADEAAADLTELARRGVERAKAVGCSALMLTLDLQILGQRHKDIRNGLSTPPRLTSSRTMSSMASAAPSTLFSTTLPVNPSVTTTSTVPAAISSP